MRNVARLMRFTSRYFVTCAVLATALYCVLPLALGLASRALFEGLSRTSGDPWPAFAVLVALQVAEVATGFGVGRAWSGFTHKTHVLLQRNLFAGILRGYGQHGLVVSPSDAISRFRDEPPNITMGSMDGICDLIGRGLFAAVAAVVMWGIDPALTVAAFVPIVVGAATSDALGTRSSLYGAAARESTSSLTGFLGDLVTAQLAVRVAGARPHMLRHLTEVSETRRRLSLRDHVFAEVVNSMNLHLVHVSTGAVLLLGASRIRDGSFTVGDLALYVVYLDQLTYLPAEIGRVITELKRTAVSIARMHALMPGEPPDVVVAPAPVYLGESFPPVPPPPPRERLVSLDVQGLTHVHPRSGRGVTDISFSLASGSFTVITGRVGAGKSTLLHAVLGLSPREAGEVRWNGQVVADPASFFVPPRTAFTPQVPRLFSETLRANILLGHPGDDRALEVAVRSAVLDADVAGFADGLDTFVGPRGVRLSGGQVQRAAAARMFLRQPELLVFDDLSSALDTDTERELWRRLFADGRAPTCLVVSHSEIALARADQVLVLEDGRLVRG